MKQEMSGKFEYFLNAIHYCMWLIDIKLGNFDRRIVIRIRSFILKHLCTNERRRKYEEFMNKEQEKIDEFFYDQENGFHIEWANHWFGYFYCGYPSLLSFTMVGIADKLLGGINAFEFIIFYGIPIGLCYIPAYRAVFSKDKYLKYFKRFKKKDKRWHRKWECITFLFLIGSIAFILLGIFAIGGARQIIELCESCN